MFMKAVVFLAAFILSGCLGSGVSQGPKRVIAVAPSAPAVAQPATGEGQKRQRQPQSQSEKSQARKMGAKPVDDAEGTSAGQEPGGYPVQVGAPGASSRAE